MTCAEAEPLLDAYLDGELDLMRSLDLEAHARRCAACAAALETEKQLSAAVAQAPYYRAAPSLRARLQSPPADIWRRPAV
ncbi:MAG TPA: zf-HC2 domain-containing protein, partial [Bryobacteraceae bacterium]|nr:zf-HC2 domain-containing protein [Bryobacteraceae bacterium]